MIFEIIKFGKFSEFYNIENVWNFQGLEIFGIFRIGYF